VSWVQNVDLLRSFVVIQTVALAYIGEAFLTFELVEMVIPREDLFILVHKMRRFGRLVPIPQNKMKEIQNDYKIVN
jgi:hypothetical protein